MSGITDEAVIEGHDLIHSAEVEEQKLYGEDSQTQPTKSEELGGKAEENHHEQERRGSKLDKVKETLHFKK